MFGRVTKHVLLGAYCDKVWKLKEAIGSGPWLIYWQPTRSGMGSEAKDRMRLYRKLGESRRHSSRSTELLILVFEQESGSFWAWELTPTSTLLIDDVNVDVAVDCRSSIVDWHEPLLLNVHYCQHLYNLALLFSRDRSLSNFIILYWERKMSHHFKLPMHFVKEIPHRWETLKQLELLIIHISI